MSRAVRVSSELVQMKPRHGEACNRCGLCCVLGPCDLAQYVFDLADDSGPCPALQGSPGQASCGLVSVLAPVEAELSQAAAVLIGAGAGCDCLINGEPRNKPYDQLRDAQVAGPEHEAALKLWGMKR